MERCTDGPLRRAPARDDPVHRRDDPDDRRSAGPVSWLSVLLLLGATVALIGAPSHAGPIFDGLVTADLFASFGKAIIFPAAAVAIIAAHGWFERDTEHAAEYAVLILFAAVGMGVMVSAT